MNENLRNIVCCLLPVLMLTSLAQTVSPMVNCQGSLAHPNGRVVTTADYVLRFSVYDAAQGASRVWGPQLFDGTGSAGPRLRVPVVYGCFNIIFHNPLF